MRTRSREQQLGPGGAAARGWRGRYTLLGLAGLLVALLGVGGAGAESVGLTQDADSGQNQNPSGASALPDAEVPVRVQDLAEETRQLRTEVAAQSVLIKQLLASLEGLMPGDAPSDLVLGLDKEAGASCQHQLTELNARLQQQQLSLTEAQRRAEKAEKLTAAMNEAQAHANTEIERLSTELAMAKTRQAESLQHAVELERRLATAEARLARLGTGELAAGPAAEPDLASTAVNTADALTAAATATLSAPAEQPASARAPVLYEVRSADTLSRISERVYGDASVWQRIFEANRDLLAAPDALSPGMSLVIP